MQDLPPRSRWVSHGREGSREGSDPPFPRAPWIVVPSPPFPSIHPSIDPGRTERPLPPFDPHPSRRRPIDRRTRERCGISRTMAWTTVLRTWKGKEMAHAVTRVVGRHGCLWETLPGTAHRSNSATNGHRHGGTWMVGGNETRGFATTHAKLKTPSGLRDRFRITATGKYVRSKSGHRHLAYDKSSKRKRTLRQPAIVHKAWAKVMKLLGHR